MELFFLFKREIKEPLRPLLLFLFISGISSTLLISVINNAAEFVSNSEVNNRSAFLFLFGVSAYLFSKKYVMDRASFLVESTVCRLRNRITDKIRHTELDTLEKIGTSSLYARLTQETTYISNIANNAINATQSAIMILFTLLYIGTVSFWSLLLILVALGIGFLAYSRQADSFSKMWYEVSMKETAFFETLGHILNGFKEVKMNRAKNESVYQDYKSVNNSLKKFRFKLSYDYNVLLIFSQSFFYILLGGILFIIPHFHAEHSQDVIKVVAAVFSIMGPFEGIMASLNMFDNASNATRNIINLEKELEEQLHKDKLSIGDKNQPITYQALPYFDNIQLQNLSYSYPPTNEQEHIFTVGPVNLTFRKGELVFITGGNGSGKSTFLKLLTGLYPPKSGQIVLDAGLENYEETPVTPLQYQQYRNLFTVIFTDFHLFDKLYGLGKTNPKVVNKLLENMELSNEKTSFKDGSFTNIHLSSGQKKRLALTISLMEDKEVYIFDEVASDLDPEFRDKYYYELIRELKERNKTVIVVSHDRHYWTVPDRLLEMKNGSIRELSREEINALLTVTPL